MIQNLNDALNAIKKSDLTLSEKKEAVIKLGLRKRDLEWLEFSGFFNEDTPLTFGVEIEGNVRRGEIVAHATPDFHFHYEGYNHTDNRSYFKFVTDGSVSGDSPIECVTPILENTTDGFASLKTCCKVLNDSGAHVNSSCGLHVHVGVGHYSGAEIVNIYKNYQKLEKLIDSFMSPSRRGNGCRWAYSLLGYDFSRCDNPTSIASIMGNNRYHKVNPMAYDRHTTVEFRQHQGSTDYKKISMWVNFCCKLVEWSKAHTFDYEVRTIQDVPFLNTDEKTFFQGRINEFARLA